MAADALYERYRWQVEQDGATAAAPDPTGSPSVYVVEVVGAWWGRYRRQQDLIDHLEDPELQRRVRMKGINADMTEIAIPDWTDEEWRVFDQMERSHPDLPKITGLHAFGRSIRALWREARDAGKSRPEAWRYVAAWARRPPSRDDFDAEVFTPPATPPPPPPARVFAARPRLRPDDLLPRYLGGERERVWEHLVSLGPAVRDPAVLPHATAVAEETMRRARGNVLRLVAGLRGAGYRFWDGLDSFSSSPTMRMAWAGGVVELPNLARLMNPPRARGPEDVFRPAGPDTEAALDELAGQGLRVPLSVDTWFRVVGEVDLSGRHPDLCPFDEDADFRGVYADPLVLFLVPDLIEEDPPHLFLALSMDAEGKAGQASGAQVDGFYSVEVPDAAADAILHGAAGRVTFVEYLRESFAWAGFPGWREAPDPPMDLVRTLTRDLEPI